MTAAVSGGTMPRYLAACVPGLLLCGASCVAADQPHRWLEADDERVSAWQAEQTARTRAVLDALPGRADLKSQLQALSRTGALSPPEISGDYLFFPSRRAERQQAVLQVQDVRSGQVSIAFDPYWLDSGGRTAMAWFVPGPAGRFIAVGLHTEGDENTTLRVVRRRTGDLLPDAIRGKPGGVFWLPDASGFVYRRLADPANPYSSQIRFHRLGSEPADDPILSQQARTGPLSRTAGPYAFMDADARWLVIAYWTSTQFNDLWVYDFQHWLDQGELQRHDIVTGEQAFSLGPIAGDTLYMQTTLDAPNGRLVAVDLARTGRERWRELLEQRSAAVLQDVHLARDRLIAVYVQDAANQVEIRKRDGRLERRLELPGRGTVRFQADPEGHVAFFSYEDFTTPDQVFRVDLRNGTYRLWARSAALPETGELKSEQVRYPSRDGTPVTMWLVYRGTLPTEPAPLLMEAYGGFDVTMSPHFDALLLPWLNAGGVYAVPNLRGGGEYGEDWYLSGVRENKQNTIDDLISAAEWLIARGITTPERLAVRGTSNGGLTAAAAIVQRPGLFAAAVLNAPLTDMLRYHRFLLAGYWTEEYGDPDDPAARRYLARYSPYHNVRDGTRYPALLIRAGDRDPRVHPMHARKFAARVQDATRELEDPNPVLLSLSPASGHGRGERVDVRVRDATDELAFLAWRLGLTEAPSEPDHQVLE